MAKEKPIKIYAVELILAVALFGGMCLFVLFGSIWNDDGLITGWFSGARILTVMAAVALGFVIGWMIFPRILTPATLLGDPDEDVAKSMSWARRREGEPPAR